MEPISRTKTLFLPEIESAGNSYQTGTDAYNNLSIENFSESDVSAFNFHDDNMTEKEIELAALGAKEIFNKSISELTDDEKNQLDIILSKGAGSDGKFTDTEWQGLKDVFASEEASTAAINDAKTEQEAIEAEEEKVKEQLDKIAQALYGTNFDSLTLDQQEQVWTARNFGDSSGDGWTDDAELQKILNNIETAEQAAQDEFGKRLVDLSEAEHEELISKGVPNVKFLLP